MITNNNSIIKHSNATEELVLIQKLLNSKFAVDIKKAINYYYVGNFNEMIKLLTTDKLNYYSKMLYSYKKSPIVYPIYENVRSLLKLYLEGMTKCITQFLDLQNVKDELIKITEKAQILDNKDKLKTYLDGLKRTMSLFKPSDPIPIVEAKISEEHATYIKLYGYPVYGIFDPQLLHDIKNNNY